MAIGEAEQQALLDYEALHRKYLEERDKRMHPKGINQYVAVEDAFADYDDDPYAGPISQRAAVVEDVTALIVGGGHTGLFTADALLKVGISDFRIVEKAGNFGGTWYWNRYPGCRCDVESYIYMPFLDELGDMPEEKYSRASDILAHTHKVARHLGLYDKALFRTAIVSAGWDDASHRWIVTTDRGDTIRARFVCFGSGPLSRPKLPGIPGIGTFRGKAFHSSRWDYGYTGGNDRGSLTGLNNKRVAIIGTGASAVQMIPEIASSCGHLYVVQRTPSAVEARDNRKTDPQWWNSLKPGWWEDRAFNFAAVSLGVTLDDQIGDNWSSTWKRFTIAGRQDMAGGRSDDISFTQKADYAKMDEIRTRIDRIVKDPVTAEALKPWYNWYCKRPLFVDGYYEAFNRDNVSLIDTMGKGLTRISENSIHFGDQSYEVDCIIYASGFETAVPPDRAAGFAMTGMGGITLAEKWQDGIRSLHGTFVRDFPNLCIIAGVRHAAASWNFSLIQTIQTRHVADVFRRCLADGVTKFDVRQSAEDAWLAEIARASTADVQFLSECTPGYVNNDGQDIDKGLYSESYGGGVLRFSEILEEWRSRDLAEDLELT